MFPRPDFFTGSTLNFAENLLYPSAAPDPSTPAIISVTETSTKEITWASLRSQVRAMALAMAAHNLQPFDRVAGFLGNHSDTVVAMLAATSLGAIWTGISADTGVALVVEKLSQIKPVLLFADNAVTSHGKVHESATKTREIVKLLPTLRTVVVFQTVESLPVETESLAVNGQALSYSEFLSAYVTLHPFHNTS
jgi:acetoacetyl-CoA synthetase